MFLYTAAFADYWTKPHKVTFDGVNKLITVNNLQSVISVKTDLYSDWKEWTQIRDNSKFLPAMRSIGGDPIDIANGISAGDIYFLLNGWKIVIPHAVQIVGTLYSEDGSTPYIINQGAGMSATVSNLVQSVTTNIGGLAPTVQQIRTELTPELSHVMALSNQPATSPISIAQAVRTELGPELAKVNAQINGLTGPQANMMLEMYRLMGLDPSKPLIVTSTTVDAGAEIHQNITGDGTHTTVTRA